MKRRELEEKLVKKAWDDEAFKQELLKNPKAVVEKETGKALPANVTVEVVEETANKAYIVLPVNPSELSDDQLDKAAGGFWCISFSLF